MPITTPRPATCALPAAGRNDDIPHPFRQGQTVLTSGHRSDNSVSLVLVRARGHALKTEGRQSLPSPGRAGPGASPAMPASPRGSREDLDDLDPIGSERAEKSKSLEDPAVYALA